MGADQRIAPFIAEMARARNAAIRETCSTRRWISAWNRERSEVQELRALLANKSAEPTAYDFYVQMPRWYGEGMKHGMRASFWSIRIRRSGSNFQLLPR
jgi:hypothetical protein